MKLLNKFITLLLFSFFVSTQINAATYEDAEPTNDSCPGENLSTIVSGTTNFTGTIESENSGQGIPGIDYSVMSIPNDGNITITWQTDQGGKEASFLVGSSCDDSSLYNGTTRADTHTTSTFSVNANDLIYVKIYDGEGKGYSITITYSIATPSPGSNLQITKIDSNDPVEVGEEFYYIIDVSNTGDSTATGVEVDDALPVGMDLNQTRTDTASGDWSCTPSGTSHNVICIHNSDIPSGATSTIYLHVTGLSSAGVVTNNVEVTDDNGSSATAFEDTTITAEIENADNLCYIENTIAANLNADINASCEKEGNFYYGNIGGQNPCVAQVIISKDNNLSTAPITGLVVTKMYAPGLSSGFATSSTGSLVLNGGAKTTLNFESFTSYEEGYKVQVYDGIIDDNNLTITDTGSDKTPNITGIGLYADYNISNTHHFGRIYACDGRSEGSIIIDFSADTIDTPITSATIAGNYNASTDTSDTGDNIKYIRTMVAADASRAIEGVHLNEYGEATPYTPTDPEFRFLITPYLVSDNCDGVAEDVFEAGTTDPLFIVVPPGEYSATGNMAVSSTVRKSTRMQLIYFDPDSLSVEGQQCILSSSTNGNFAGVPSCANSEVQYSDAFGQDAWDRCGIDSGMPCLSSNHGIADVTDPSYDPATDHIYVNDYGCYLCTVNIQPVCSTDNFAIRPERFDANIVETYTPTHAPNLLRSGQDYNSSLTARNADDAVSTTYTVLNFDEIVDTPEPTKYFNTPTLPWVEATGTLMHGSSSVNAQDPTHIVNGLSSSSAGGSLTAEALVGVTFDDVGRVKIDIADVNWSQVDNDDTPMDCNSTEHTYICGELNTTFIPHHFAFAELNITNHAGPDTNFTYIADQRGMPVNVPDPIRSPMAARVHTRIEARNKQDNITQNFREDGVGVALYYENNISVTQNVVIPTARTLLNPDAYIFGADANESEIDDKLVGFGRTTVPETDDPGTRNIKWDESSFPLEFNFRRDYDKPANPFDVNGSYLSIKLVSQYVDPDDGDIADIDGSRIGDKNTSTCISPPNGSCVQQNADANATFYYGKAHPSQDLYDDIITPSVNTPVLVKIYCNPLEPVAAPVVCADYNIPLSSQTNEYTWWLSPEHRMDLLPLGHGDIELEVGTIDPVAGTATVTTAQSVTINADPNAADPNVLVTATSADRPMTVNIDFVTDDAAPDYTDLWLIYNQYSNTVPSPFYRVRFIGISGWAGHGDTGHVVDSNASFKKNRRLGW